MPVEPESNEWGFPPLGAADEHGLLAVGADLEPGTILSAYRRGIFPMPVGPQGLVGWWSPEPRGIIPLDGLRVSRSLRRSCRRYRIRVDSDFEAVIDACRGTERPHGWISPDVREAYLRLHRMGWAHSVEAWTADDRLVGGLYGVSIGGLFAGESMFHHARDASKVALVALVRLLSADRVPRLLDVQWATDHLRSLGAVEIPRSDYEVRVGEAVELVAPNWTDLSDLRDLVAAPHRAALDHPGVDAPEIQLAPDR